MTRELVVLAAFVSLIALVTSTTVIFWRNGQRQPSWAQWKAGLKERRPWYLIAAVSSFVFAALLIVMRFSAVAS